MKIMFIDPGLEGTGYAGFERTATGFELRKYGVEHHLSKQNTTEAINHIVLNMASNWGAYREIVIEHPELWAGDVRGYASAKSGNLFKLCRLIGGLEVRALPRKTSFIFPREWKGQLPKEVVIQRIQKRLGFAPGNHEADAIGMGISQFERWVR